MLLDLRIGIDVGGTNTDAVVLDRDGQLLAKAKRPTTADGFTGIASALGAVLADAAIDPARVTHVMLGTTQATNAVVERKRLRRVGVIRIGAPMTTAAMPLCGWPSDLRAVVSAGEVVVAGGADLDSRPIGPLDHEAIARFAEQNKAEIETVAITSVFAPVSPEHEIAAASIVRNVLGDIPISLSHQIGGLGLLERENATVLNASLTHVLRDLAEAVESIITDLGLSPTLLFAQNDGTLMAMEHALEYPVLTIGSGPANSIRGAAHLTGLTDAIVVDVGGTTTDVGALVGGHPRRSTGGVEIGGISTNFAMPDLLSIGIGGGTIVNRTNGSVTLGPDSVGFRLTSEALCFGGTIPTLSDALKAAHRGVIGSTPIDQVTLPLLHAALEQSDAAVADAIDQMKLTPSPMAVIAIGGGSGLVPQEISGINKVIQPDHYDVANAIGAAIAHASGQVDEIVSFRPDERAGALERARTLACERAVAAGADPRDVAVVEQEEVPLAYLSEPTVRIRVKAAGALWVGGDLQDRRRAHV